MWTDAKLSRKLEMLQKIGINIDVIVDLIEVYSYVTPIWVVVECVVYAR